MRRSKTKYFKKSEMKKSVEMKNTLNEISGRLEKEKEQTGNLEDRVIESNQV